MTEPVVAMELSFPRYLCVSESSTLVWKLERPTISCVRQTTHLCAIVVSFLSIHAILPIMLKTIKNTAGGNVLGVGRAAFEASKRGIAR